MLYRRILLPACWLLACVSRPGVPSSRATVASPLSDSEPRAIAATVGAMIREAMAREGIPGAAFVFVKDDRVIWARDYGFADREQRRPVDQTTRWPLASVTKVFTAVAALQLVDRGALGLDEDINRYLKRLSAPAAPQRPITLAHLLSHTGGLDELPGRQFDPTKVPAPDLAGFLRGRLIAYRDPGQSTAYSTYGIALAAIAVEDVSGLPLHEYLTSQLFAPCEMRSSLFMRQLGDEAGVATPYELEQGSARPVAHEWYLTTPASSLVASTADVARFMTMHLQDGRCGSARVLSERSARAMRSQQATVHPRVPGWGYGFQIDGENGRWIAEHGGDIAGFSALLTLVLEIWGQRWVELEKDLFIRGDGESRLGFGRDAAGRVRVVSGGSWRVAERMD